MGFIYALVHPLHRGWVKVGRTTDLRRRLMQYQTGDPQRNYRFIFTKQVTQPGWAEGEAHHRLEAAGIRCKGEWFRASHKRVVAILDQVT